MTHVTLEGNVGKLTAYEVLCNTKTNWKAVTGLESIMELHGLVRWLTNESIVTVGRVKVKDAYINGIFYIAMHGKEMTFKKFEILQFEHPS